MIPPAQARQLFVLLSTKLATARYVSHGLARCEAGVAFNIHARKVLFVRERPDSGNRATPAESPSSHGFEGNREGYGQEKNKNFELLCVTGKHKQKGPLNAGRRIIEFCFLL